MKAACISDKTCVKVPDSDSGSGILPNLYSSPSLSLPIPPSLRPSVSQSLPVPQSLRLSLAPSLSPHRHRKMERTSFPFLAFDPDLPVLFFDKFLAQDKS